MGSVRSSKFALPIGLVVATIALLFLRRPDQFLHPYIWVEDGRDIIKQFAAGGWRILIEPTSGYLILATKLVSYIAYRVSVLWAPEIELVLTVLAACGTVLAVAFSPTHLRWAPLCAIAILVIPTGPEIYAVGSYTFWWTGFLLLLTPFWREDRQMWRNFFILFGGLSNPLIFPVTLLLVFRAAVERTRQEIVAVLLAGAACFVQFLAIRSIQAVGGKVYTLEMSWQRIRISIDKFAGFFFVGPFTHDPNLFAYCGFVVLAAIGILVWFSREKLDRWFYLLVATYAVVCASVAARGPVEIYHPYVAGPRYFLYPYTLLVWIGIWLASVSRPPTRAFLGFALVVAVAYGGKQLQWRTEKNFDWRGPIADCAHRDNSLIPIQYDGSVARAWTLTIDRDDCRALLAGSIIQPRRAYPAKGY